ncbi:MAG: glycine cleavage system aminomethyltransferase GcvT [Clostridia bacterium]|nr:glycine cleavage system aminomethyltransferase GcvT [Clostridia bacterium]MBQ3091348.1 glycine cleavage system aminomethyltransferase GcvT [Clostridia bacterium]
MEKKTPLYDQHVALGGKIVPFAGYLLPVEYPTGVIAEHNAVREGCGLFDVSHMAELLFEGPGALASLNHIITNDLTGMAVGRVRYSAMCNENGGVVDDLIVYRVAENAYLAVVNAANHEKDAAHMRANLLPDTVMTDLSEQTAQVALQGPKAKEVLASLIPAELAPKKYYTFTPGKVNVGGVDCLISRTGYTGSFGYELYCAAEDGVKLWNLLLEAGKEYGLIPCGLGARDTLRLEAGMPLYGHEMTDDISPLEAGLEWAVKMDKPEFIGKQALLDKGTPARKRIGLKAIGRGIIREHQEVMKGDVQIGMTTSGTFCPYLKQSCAMALVENGSVELGDHVDVIVRGRKVEAEVTEYMFYKA